MNAIFSPPASHPARPYAFHMNGAAAVSLAVHAIAIAALLATSSQRARSTPSVTAARPVRVSSVPRSVLIDLARPASPRRTTLKSVALRGELSVDTTPWARHADAPAAARLAPAIALGVFDAAVKTGVASVAPIGRVVVGGFNSGTSPTESEPTSGAVRRGAWPGTDAGERGSRDAGADDAPLQVLSEPVPRYPEEAQHLGITGEVLLLVLFAASGELRVVRTVSGLGHGLDEAAIAAVQQLKFVPAVKQGRAIDVVMQISVVFKL